MKKQILENLEIYELTNEFQIYVDGVLHQVWKSGDNSLDSSRVGMKLTELVRKR